MKEQLRQRASGPQQVAYLRDISRRPHLLAPLSLLCIALAGCTVGPDFKRPEVPANAGYSREKLTATAQADIDAGGAAQRLIAGMDIPGQWWTLFRSPTLNALVEEALRANPDVSAAQAALRQANELVYADQASLFPSVNANASKTREKVSGVTAGLPESPILTVSSASLNVSYARMCLAVPADKSSPPPRKPSTNAFSWRRRTSP